MTLDLDAEISNLKAIAIVSLAGAAASLALLIYGCSGSVEVTGIPDSIELVTPFCVPPKDAGSQ